MTKHKKPKIYAVYEGDEFLCLGTVDECCKFLNILPRTFYAFNYRYKNNLSEKMYIKLEDNDERSDINE